MDQEAPTGAAPQCRADGGGTVAVAATPRRRGRCFDVDEPPTTTAAAGRRCRSCAAVAIADCVALGCCPCAVVSLLGLALVKAPLVVGRRCVGRLRRQRRLLLHQKRVRDVAASSAAEVSVPTATACEHPEEEKGGKVKGVVAPGAAATMTTAASTTEAELAWLEEMYRVGHWGFGRVSFSGEKESPVQS